jgi:hypothetical protein
VVKIVEPSVDNNSSLDRSCPIGICFRLFKMTNVSLAKQPEDDADADADAADESDRSDPAPMIA